MKRFLLFFFVFLLSGLINKTPAQRLTIPTQTTKPEPTITQVVLPTSGPRFAACDLCGFCPPSEPPKSWLSCKKCLYPETNTDPWSFETLKVDSESNLPPTPYPGKQYSFLGCIGGGSGDFSSQESAAKIIQSLLNIVFSISGGIAFLYLLYGSFIIAVSQSDPEKINYGKRLVSGAIIGLIFSLSSVFLVNFIASGILKVPGFGESP